MRGHVSRISVRGGSNTAPLRPLAVTMPKDMGRASTPCHAFPFTWGSVPFTCWSGGRAQLVAVRFHDVWFATNVIMLACPQTQPRARLATDATASLRAAHKAAGA